MQTNNTTASTSKQEFNLTWKYDRVSKDENEL